ncbi:hypothetical protein WN944_018227 [Citrus x changshan-huyou]|uniref:Transcription elongation factor 1 homolog n=1 Tax=Citrus x changshan-huyou TaxID=2935761 RepID=A0AAP0LTN9_9ROSI
MVTYPDGIRKPQIFLSLSLESGLKSLCINREEEVKEGKGCSFKKKKGMERLDTEFRCRFCGHRMSGRCRIYKKIQTGEAFCWNCFERFWTQIHGLIEPVDIYAEWIHACEHANNS